MYARSGLDIQEVRLSNDITVLLAAVADGDERAHDKLFPQVYDELRRIAASQMRREHSGHTLQATALVNEAYLKMAGSDATPNDRVHFFAMAAQNMRRILVDHARTKRREKRGGDQLQVTLDDSALAAPKSEDGIIELDEALEKFAQFDPRAAKAVELMFFGGLTYEETADVLGTSKTTVFEDLKIAKAWLAKEMG
ncbi:MAG: sigma-70 family RNA polymerase sigma factor [Pseudomonadota bacterium]